MDSDSKVRPLNPLGSERRAPARANRNERSAARTQIVLAIALAVAIVLLVTSYLGLSNRIDSLELEARALRAAVIERDELIAAQRTRLDDVRGKLQELLALIEQPVDGAAPASSEPPTQP